MTDYSKMTQEDYDSILIEILKQKRASQLIVLPGIYEIVSEEFNNEILKIWEQRQKTVA